MPELKSQKKLICEIDWDVLIILDACRYDYFHKKFDKYLDGELKIAESPGSTTVEWAKRVFYNGDWVDTIYVSGNPRINSLDIGEFESQKIFLEVVDVWNAGWLNRYNTVPPEKVNEAAIKARKENPESRIVAHYIQPHWPFLSIGATGIRELSGVVEKMAKEEKPGKTDKVREYLGKALRRIVGEKITENIRKIIGTKPPISPTEAVARRMGQDELEKAYSENVELSLEYASKLSNKLNGKKIVTADHGELLGEHDDYAHPGGKRYPELVKVPWLEVENESRWKIDKKFVGV